MISPGDECLAFDRAAHCYRIVPWAEATVVDEYGADLKLAHTVVAVDTLSERICIEERIDTGRSIRFRTRWLPVPRLQLIVKPDVAARKARAAA